MATHEVTYTVDDERQNTVATKLTFACKLLAFKRRLGRRLALDGADHQATDSTSFWRNSREAGYTL